MTIEKQEQLLELFKSTFPYYQDNAELTIDDDVIKEAIIEADTHIPPKCKSNRDRIIVYLAMHFILKKDIDKKAFEIGQVEQLGTVTGFTAGDISYRLANSNKKQITQPPKSIGSTKYGTEAYRLMALCVKSRVGLIV